MTNSHGKTCSKSKWEAREVLPFHWNTIQSLRMFHDFPWFSTFAYCKSSRNDQISFTHIHHSLFTINTRPTLSFYYQPLNIQTYSNPSLCVFPSRLDQIRKTVKELRAEAGSNGSDHSISLTGQLALFTDTLTSTRRNSGTVMNCWYLLLWIEVRSLKYKKMEGKESLINN